MRDYYPLSAYANLLLVAQQAQTCMDVDEFLEIFIPEDERALALEALILLNVVQENYVPIDHNVVGTSFLSWIDF